MIKELWQVVDKLEMISTPNFFDDTAKQIELFKAIKALKQIITEVEDDLK